MTTGNDAGSTWLLRLDAVRWSIRQLARKRAHPFFLAYLHLRSRAVSEGDESEIRPRWNELGSYLFVPGGPPRKPYYRPLFDPPGNPSRYWLNENLAGSFAPSSLRVGMPPMQVVLKGARSTFSLRQNHAELALHHLLYDEPLAIYPFAIFLYRDFGFLANRPGPGPGPKSLIDIFQQDWHFTRDEDQQDDFGTLFDMDGPEFTQSFFEEAPPGEGMV